MIHRLAPAYATQRPCPPHSGAPGGFPTVARRHPGAQHIAVNNKELSLALAGRLMAALDGMPRPLLISCRCVLVWGLGFGWVGIKRAEVVCHSFLLSHPARPD